VGGRSIRAAGVQVDQPFRLATCEARQSLATTMVASVPRLLPARNT